jgi:hypothetical protein
MSEPFDSWHSYPSLFAIGHRALNELLLDPVLVEEKIDGSQFSFGLFAHSEDGELVTKCRSKSVQLNLIAPEKMFSKAIEVVQALTPVLHIGWTYRAEYLQKPKHNALAYDRTPEKHLMVFDINPGQEHYLSYWEKKEECERIGLECVPLIYEGMIESASQFRAMLDRVSVLGGQKIEGVVVKNYRRFGPDKKVLMGKFVSEAFKEVHNAEWKASNPGKADIVQALIETLRTPARWNKAIQHLREQGLIDDSPKDIGLLFKEVHADIRKECVEIISEKLVEWAMPNILRGVCAGLPEWYKDKLVERQFDDQAPDSDRLAA